MTAYILEDSVRWLSSNALHEKDLFTSPGQADGKKLLALRKMYEAGRRPLHDASATHESTTVANFLLLWLSSLPEPLLSRRDVHAMAAAAAAAPSTSTTSGVRHAELRGVLRGMDGASLDALHTLFQFLHHHWINQPDRAQSLQQLARLFGPLIAGLLPRAGLAHVAEGAALVGAAATLIADFRPVFTQPVELKRYEQDAAVGTATARRSEDRAGPDGGVQDEDLEGVLDVMLDCLVHSSFPARPPVAKAGMEPCSPTGVMDVGFLDLEALSEGFGFGISTEGERSEEEGARPGVSATAPATVWARTLRRTTPRRPVDSGRLS